jgi:hypothetical protein
MVVITDVYAAWKSPSQGITGKLVVDALAGGAGKRIVYLPRRTDVGPFIPGPVTGWSPWAPGTSPWSPTKASA